MALNEHNTRCVYSSYGVGRVLCNQKGKGGSVGGGLANVGSIRVILRVYIITVSSTVHSNRHKMLDKSLPATTNEKCFHNACLPRMVYAHDLDKMFSDCKHSRPKTQPVNSNQSLTCTLHV